MQQVFLSYSRRDDHFVRRLAADLEKRGVDVWLDTDDLDDTDEDRWRRSIVQAIKKSSALVVVLSPDSVESAPVERELTIAAETKRRIIPIVHRPCELSDGLQFELAGIQRIDFSTLPYKTAIEHLLRRIRSAPLPPPAVDDRPSPEADPPTTGTADGRSETEAPAGAGPVGEIDTSTEADQSADGAETTEDGSAGRGQQTDDAGGVADESGGGAGDGSDDDSDDEPSGGGWWDDRQRRVLAIGGAAVVAVLALVGVIAAMSAGGGSPDADGSSTTAITTESVTTSRAVETTGSVTTASPATTGSVEEPGTSAPPPTTVGIAPDRTADAAVVSLLTELQDAYNDHDWDAVRRININHQAVTDEGFTAIYGTPDRRPPRTVRSNYRIATTELTGESTWHVLGGIFAWREETEGEATTLLGCTEWDVDLAAGTTTQIPLTGSDGELYPRVNGWVPADQFDATIAERCGVSPAGP